MRDRLLGFPMLEQLNGLGIIPDWQFYPQPPPFGTGKFETVTVDLPGACPSYGISGAMGLGQNEGMPDVNLTDTQLKWMTVGFIVLTLHSMLRLPLAIVDGVHGYKRNNEDGASAAGWGALGFLAPVTTTAVALYQGYGKPKQKQLKAAEVNYVVWRKVEGKRKPQRRVATYVSKTAAEAAARKVSGYVTDEMWSPKSLVR